MDILGVGGWELVAILLIMLIVAGPKRMILWSYQLGKYIAMLRKMWSETAEMLQKEFDNAGVDVQVPKDIPTRADLDREISRALAPMTKPFQEAMEATQKELESTQRSVSLSPVVLNEAKPSAEDEAPAVTHAQSDFGTWSEKNDKIP